MIDFRLYAKKINVLIKTCGTLLSLFFLIKLVFFSKDSEQLPHKNTKVAQESPFLNNSRSLAEKKELSQNEGLIQKNPTHSSLELELIALIFFENKFQSIAVLEDSISKKNYALKKNDEIPGCLRLLKIETDHIVFMNLKNHHKEYLKLKTSLGATVVKEQMEVPSQALNPPSIFLSSPPNHNLQKEPLNHPETEEDSHMIKDTQDGHTQASLAPYLEHGQFNGYQIFNIKPKSVYDKFELEDGDVILNLNGEKIDQPSYLFEKLKHFNEATENVEITLKVKRGNNITLIKRKKGKSYTIPADALDE